MPGGRDVAGRRRRRRGLRARRREARALPAQAVVVLQPLVAGRGALAPAVHARKLLRGGRGLPRRLRVAPLVPLVARGGGGVLPLPAEVVVPRVLVGGGSPRGGDGRRGGRAPDDLRLLRPPAPPQA